MLFSDMRCFTCGNPPEKETLAQGKPGMTSFSAARDGLLDVRSYEVYDICICDSCLIRGGRQGCVYRTVTKNRPPNYYEYTWNPDGDDTLYRLPPPKLTVYSTETEKA